ARAKVMGYLQVGGFGHHPPGHMLINAQRVLQALATVLDLLEGSGAVTGRRVLAGGERAGIVPGARLFLASMVEQDLARRVAMLRRKLLDAKSCGKLGGRGQGERQARPEEAGAEAAEPTRPRRAASRAAVAAGAVGAAV
ncbi:unnamed protein product, partial [Prorocentrum cordatum]